MAAKWLSRGTTRPSLRVTTRSMRRGECRVVGGDQRRHARLAHQRAPARRTRRSAVAGSRLPVGSSASSSRGALASARAMATRCCSPPDSSRRPVVGALAEAQLVEQLPARAPAPRRWPSAGDHLRQRHILHRRELRQQVMELVDEADVVRRTACARRRSGRRRRGRRSMTSPASGCSSSPAICSSVDLPAPDGPTSATISPAATSRSAPLQHRQRRRPGDVSAARRPQLDRTAPSLIAQRLDRIEPGGAPGRVAAWRGTTASAMRDDRDHLAQSTLAGSCGQEVDLGDEQPPARQRTRRTAGSLDVEAEDERRGRSRPACRRRRSRRRPCRKIRRIEPCVAPMVRRMAMSRPLFFTSMTRPEMMLSAATTMTASGSGTSRCARPAAR